MGRAARIVALSASWACLAACERPAPAPAAAGGGAGEGGEGGVLPAPLDAGGDPDPAAPALDAAAGLGAEEIGWHVPVADREPATDAAREVVDILERVDEQLTETRYQYVTLVRERTGVYRWDCSGMVAWVLERAAPQALAAVHADRPLARDFYDVIADSPTDDPRRGWRRVATPEEIAPGDLFAWRKPDFWAERPNTGHVGFVIGTPQPHPLYAGVWVMRVADATKMLHEADSRPADGEGGFGTATMAFEFGNDGTPLAYGWYGASQSPDTFVPTRIAFGRVSR